MKQEDQKRDKWDNKVQAFLSLIGFAVGVANFWRFPYMCQKNGGGTFLIPYAVMTLIIGFPLTYIELLVGQKFQKGPLLAWGAISPYARGIGIASCICCCIGASYYAAVLGYSIFYFSNSFRSPLPWSQCPIIRNESNFTHAKVDPECSIAQPAVYYFYKETLDATHSINDGGGIYWKAVICLAAGWIILYFCLMQGIKSSGKVVYVTATLPYVFLIAFLVRGMTLPGHENGLAELIRPNITALRNPYVWKDAAAQIFYSLGGGFGAYIALGSYNPPQMKTARYAVSVVLINALTSLLAATVVFSILGSSATQIFNQCLKTASVNPATFNGTEYGSCSMRKILLSFGQGPGLAFIAFSTVLQQFHGAQVWSALFFFMLFTMGIDSLFGIIEVVSTSIRDTRFFSRWPRQIVLALLCSLFFAIGLIVVQRSGGYYLEIADNHFIALALLVIAMSECIVVAFHDSYHRANPERTIMPSNDGRLPFRIVGLILTGVCILILTSVVIIVTYGIDTRFQYHAWVGKPIRTSAVPYPSWMVIVTIIIMVISAIAVPLWALCTPIFRRIYPQSIETTTDDYSDVQRLSMAI